MKHTKRRFTRAAFTFFMEFLDIVNDLKYASYEAPITKSTDLPHHSSSRLTLLFFASYFTFRRSRLGRFWDAPACTEFLQD